MLDNQKKKTIILIVTFITTVAGACRKEGRGEIFSGAINDIMMHQRGELHNVYERDSKLCDLRMFKVHTKI